jgi:hypothetical protein
MTINKKYLAALGVAVAAVLILTGKGGDDWVPPPSGKKGIVKKENYLDLRQQAFENRGAGEVPAFPASPVDPFKSKAYGGNHGAAKTLKRSYTLKGILLKTPLMAVILDGSGESHVVGAGETFGGVTVVKITNTGVTLKDAYGGFTLEQK